MKPRRRRHIISTSLGYLFNVAAKSKGAGGTEIANN